MSFERRRGKSRPDSEAALDVCFSFAFSTVVSVPFAGESKRKHEQALRTLCAIHDEYAAFSRAANRNNKAESVCRGHLATAPASGERHGQARTIRREPDQGGGIVGWRFEAACRRAGAAAFQRAMQVRPAVKANRRRRNPEAPPRPQPAGFVRSDPSNEA